MTARVKFNLKTITPVHIGCSERMSPYSDYIYKEGKVYYIDQKKLENYLERQENADELIDNFVESIKSQVNDSKKNIETFFIENGINSESFIAKVLEASNTITQEIHKNIHTGGRPYIPGSSVKGAIRTALLYAHFKEMGRNELKEEEFKSKRGIYTGKDIFGAPLEDKLKYILITDTNPLDKKYFKIFKTEKINIEKTSSSMPIIKEAIDKSVELELSVDFKGEKYQLEKGFSYLKGKDKGKFFTKINEFYIDCIKREINELNKNNKNEFQDIVEFYKSLLYYAEKLMQNKTGAILRIGSGKTFFENTIVLAYTKGVENIIKLDKKRDLNCFPKTRSFIVNKEGLKQPMGWVEISEK